MIAQRIQVSQLPVKGGPVNFTRWRGLSIARDIYRSEGLRGYYKGTGAYLLMYVPGAAFQWGSYEVCKRFFHRMNDSFFLGWDPLELGCCLSKWRPPSLPPLSRPAS